MRINNTIIKPLISEKSMAASNNNEYTFKVRKNANKNLIKNEITRMYNVEVQDVRTMIMPGKPKRVLRTRLATKTPQWKKAIIKLKEGQSIDLFPKE